MKYRKLKEIRTLIIIFIIFISTSIHSKTVSAEELEKIKVGFPTVSGFTEKKDGLYTGYAYEYLREISIYTNWEYEFVEKNLEDLLEDLKNGDIDILAGMIKDEATMDIYDFPKYESGQTYTTLSILKDDNNFDESKLMILDGLNIGYFEKAKSSLNNFFEFCEENKIKDINMIPYSSTGGRKALVEKMKSGEVDAIIGGDLTLDSEEHIVAKFGGKPHYFATTKGNSQVIEGLNQAIYKIKEDNPNFDKNLYDKYFVANDYNALVMTKDEMEHIKNMKPLKAVYVDGLMPVQYYDEVTNSHKGIYIDAMKLLSERVGIKFEFVTAKTYEEAYKMMENDEVDIFIGAVNDYLIADKYNFVLTKAYIRFEVLKVSNSKHNTEKDKEIIALPIGHGPLYITGEYEIRYYDNIEECLRAVDEGIVDATYANSYSISNYIAVGYYNNIVVMYTGGETEIAVGITKEVDNYSRDIINKLVYSLSDKDIEKIANNNTLNIEHSITIKDFFYTNSALCLTIAGVILFIISFLIYVIVKMRFDKIKEDKQRLFEKTQIDSLTGVYNREACEKFVRKYLKEKDDLLYCAFIIIDIDYFKEINDRLGHKIGDKSLILFSEVLKETFSSENIVARLGGDEFIVFIKDIKACDISNVEETIKKICKLMNKEIEHNGVKQKTSLSLGCVMTKFNRDFNELYTIADETLYEVKRNGRNGYKIKKLD